MTKIRAIRKTDSAKALKSIRFQNLTRFSRPRVKAFLDFICELIDENVYIQINKKPTLKWEKAWLKDLTKKIKDGEAVWLGAWEGKKLIASTQARRGLWNERDNASIGLSVLKSYRRKGLGEKLMRMIIRIAKKRLNPKNIYLSVATPNLPALSLYRKVGFKKFARFPNWAKKNNKYFDVLYMLLKK